LPHPGCPEALALERQECQFIDGVDGAQARVEFEAIDDAHLIIEPDVLWP
jgi:hypothetical protein